MRKDDRVYVEHILSCISRIEQFTASGSDVFFGNGPEPDAVARNLQVMGESAKHISTEIRTRHPEVNWKGLIGLRNILVHDYMGIDSNAIWDIVTNDLEIMKIQMHQIRDEL